jgi:hypothetical protein
MKDRKWSRPITGEWASALQEYVKVTGEEVPKGWKNTRETLKAMGIKYVASGGRSYLLQQMVLKGILEKKRFRIPDLSGRRLMMMDHYRLPSGNKTSGNRKATANSN